MAKIQNEKEVRRQIKLYLRRLGIYPNLLGYKYLTEAIWLSLNDESYLHGLTKRLYPTIALTYGTKPHQVERTIRHAVELAESEEKTMLFAHLRNVNVTNLQFISTVTEEINYMCEFEG